MADIQIPISCEETFGYSPVSDLPAAEYDSEKDYTLYGDTKPQTYVTVKPGQFVIFFPQDGHAPCIIDKPEIKKAIFKVRI
jgi:YhcH/YjgK/YiaL family protein